MKVYIISVFLISSISAGAQLNIGSGTHWKTDASTYVVINNLDLKYDGQTNPLPGIFKFAGNIDNSIIGNQLPTFTKLELAKTAGVKLVLGTDIQVSESFLFNGGNCELNGHTIFLGTNALLHNESETSRIQGISGYIQITATLNAPSQVNPGNLGIVISSGKNLGSTEIRRGHKSSTNGSNAGNSVLRYFDITPTFNDELNATLRFSYLNAELNGLNENNLVLWKSPNSLTWSPQGFSMRDISQNYVEKTAISNLSQRWTLSSVGNPLPVTGLQLKGKWRDQHVQLDWMTFSEENNNHFKIERKYSNENDFHVIGTKNSIHTGGSSQQTTSYTWTDATVSQRNGVIQYRLQQVDNNGSAFWSNVIAIHPAAAPVFIEKIYPTISVQQSLFVQTGNKNLRDMQLSVYDASGKLILQKLLDYAPQTIQLPLLVAGAYYLRLSSGQWKYQTTFIKE